MNFEIKKESAIVEIKKFFDLQDAHIKALEEYVWLVLQENNRYNLIGQSTAQDIWNRHVLDSAQLIKFIKDKNIKLVDFGSGAGFPGIVLSILGVKEVHLVEKSFRKADFLKRAKLVSPNQIFVHQINLEELPIKDFDCITSRAFASLDKLVVYAKKFLKKDGYCLFLKGRSLPEEIIAAKKISGFEYEVVLSLTASDSGVIRVFGF
jgi:16S rRNA (guanine527-N7)-methyltransferase